MPKISGAKQIINPDEKEKICREVLTSLPEWSGKDKSIDVHAAHAECSRCGRISTKERCADS